MKSVRAKHGYCPAQMQNTVAEGVATTRSVYQLAARLQVEMPIVHQVYQALYENKDPKQAITELMTRQLKAE
ncbi:hypothetical protein MASR1M36_08360 [Candidatus Cloacimonadaceae bacterium]